MWLSGFTRIFDRQLTKVQGMKRFLIAVPLMLAGLAPQAWADQPELVASAIDPSQIEIVAVKPRSADSRPVIVSVPAGGSGQPQAAEALPATKGDAVADRTKTAGQGL